MKKSNTIYSALEAAAVNNEIKSMVPTGQYWLAAKQYAEKKLKPMAATGKNDMLNQAMGYDTNNADLIQDVIVKLIVRYEYLARKFNKINQSKTASAEEKTAEFNKILSTVIPSLLADEWCHVSEETAYEELDENGKPVQKTGKGVRATHTAISLDQNQSSSEGSGDEVTLMDCLSSPDISAADRAVSAEAITDYMGQLIDYPRQFLGFMSMCVGISTGELIDRISCTSYSAVFNEVLELFSIQYECPALLNLKNYYSEKDLTYTGVMPLEKVLSNDRSFGKKRIKKYIEDNHLR